MPDIVEIENGAGLARVTCGWKLPGLKLDAVRRFWRDVHSPAIARRAGVYDYRHSPFDPVRTDVFTAIPGIAYDCPADAQLMWQSDVRYADAAGLAAFGASPDGAVKALMLSDIEMIVDRSTTYLAVGENARTLRDVTGNAAPAGPSAFPSFGVFFRQRRAQGPFRDCLRRLAARWAATDGVLRIRLNLFETPDMEAERKAGYPIKTHPPEQQYQAWIELVLADDAVAKRLLTPDDGIDYAADIATIHCYPVPAVYTFNYRGRPTLLGLRGYAACEAIAGLQAVQHTQASLLEWMYGPVAKGGPAT